MSATAFIGRAHELAALDHALANARGGDGSVVLLAGPPGIGKTRTAQAAAERAATAGMLVLWGRCPEEPGAPPYWAWRQALRRCIAGWDDAALRDATGADGADLAAFDAELARRLGLASAAAGSTPEARFRLFDAVAGFWQRVARQRPLLLLFDDLHCADLPTLKLLEHIAAEMPATPLTIVGTYRDAEVTREHPLLDALAQAARHVPVQQLKLAGFNADESARFVGGVARGSWAAAPQLLAELHDRTDGHPLFLVEVARFLDETQRGALPAGGALPELARLPHAARDVIGSRLSRLPLACAHVLGNAAVIGRRFALELLAPLLNELSEAQCLEAIEQARRASLVEPLPDDAQTYQFTHALIREALYEEMPAPRRARLHLRIARALEQRHRADPTPVLSALSYHYFEARTVGGADQAAHYARRAGQHATDSVASEEAAVQYQRALQALAPQQDAERCELLLALGSAQDDSTRHVAALASFADAACLARELKLPQAMARAALGYENLSWRETNLSAVAAALLKEAVLMNSPLDSAQRVLLLAALARSLVHAGRLDTAVEMHRAAVGIARRLGDPAALLMALIPILPAQWATELLPLRLAAGREMLDIAIGAGHLDLALEYGTVWHVFDLMEVGDVDAAHRAATWGIDERAMRRKPFCSSAMLGCQAMIALHLGHFGEAERLIVQGLRHATRYNQATGLAAASAQMFCLRREQGRLAEVAPALDLFRRTAPVGGTWLPGYALLCCELGRHDEALDAFEQLARDDFARDDDARFLWRNLPYLAEICAWLGDARRAEPLYERLLPYSGRSLVFGGSPIGCGAADRLLGMLAATLERWDPAEQHFERAIEVDTASRGRPWLAHTRHQYAAMLVERKRAGDAARAAALLDAALPACREIGMRALEQRVLALQQAATGRDHYPAGLSAREVQVLLMVAEGRTNADIAKALFRSANTVANHVRNILAKIGAGNRTEAAAFAVRQGLVKRQ